MESISTEALVKKGAAHQPQHLIKNEILWIKRVKIFDVESPTYLINIRESWCPDRFSRAFAKAL